MIHAGAIEMWTFAHQLPQILQDKKLRIIAENPVMVHWSFDDWTTASDLEARGIGLDCWFADLPLHRLQAVSRISFTCRWEEGWEGKNCQVMIAAGHATPQDLHAGQETNGRRAS